MKIFKSVCHERFCILNFVFFHSFLLSTVIVVSGNLAALLKVTLHAYVSINLHML